MLNVHEMDCLDFLPTLGAESADLVYADPPFCSGRNYADEAGSFSDRFGSMENYLDFMRPRIEAMHGILKQTGSIYLHCDQSASHRLRCLLDDIFGANKFRNEIIWCYSNGGRSKSRFCRKHDVIFAYAKGKFPTWTDYRIAARPEYIAQMFTNIDENGRKFRTRKAGGKQYLYFENDGVTCNDWWADIPPVGVMAHERINYPTQKPVALLERIISASSNEGDVVVDPFCGSGTTGVACSRLGRRFIGCDNSKDAIAVSSARLNNRDDLFAIMSDSPIGKCA